MELQGSNNAVLDQDVQTQLLTLFAKVDDPNAFAGDFKQALEATQRQAQDIIAKIAAGQQPTAAELKKFKTVCKAVEVGTNAWKSDIETQFPAPRTPQIQTVLDSLEIYKNQLIAVMNCAGATTTTTGGNDFKELYAHLLLCNFNDANTAALGIERQDGAMDKFIKPPSIPIEDSACFDDENPTDAPVTDIHNWYDKGILFENWKHLYENWGNFITIIENGKYIHIARKVTDVWGDEKFLFVEAGNTEYKEFKPVGYSCPKDTYIAYGESLNNFGEMMEKGIIIATTTFATSGLGSAANLGILGEIGLNMGVETTKQLVTLYIKDGKDFSMQTVVDSLDMFDIAIETLPIVNKTIGVMGGKEIAILAKNYMKDILTAVFDYNNKEKWETFFNGKKSASEILLELLTDRLAGELIGKYATTWETSFTDAGVKKELAVRIIQEFSIKTKEFAFEILNFHLNTLYKNSDFRNNNPVDKILIIR